MSGPSSDHATADTRSTGRVVATTAPRDPWSIVAALRGSLVASVLTLGRAGGSNADDRRD